MNFFAGIFKNGRGGQTGASATVFTTTLGPTGICCLAHCPASIMASLSRLFASCIWVSIVIGVGQFTT